MIKIVAATVAAAVKRHQNKTIKKIDTHETFTFPTQQQQQRSQVSYIIIYF